jgi:dTDP-4-dehydrorhamnose reductase
MRLLITGARGQLGHDVVTMARIRGFDTVALGRDRLDITRAESAIRGIHEYLPDLLINCAAYTAVDRAEQEVALAFAANRDGPSHLATACSHAGIPLIHISTDYVFDGRKQGLYNETDPVGPINAYGRSKAAGETEVQNKSERHIILRSAWGFGTHGNNFVKTMLKLGQEQETIRVVDDQIGCPTFTGSLAGAIIRIAALYRRHGDVDWGIYHYGGQPPVSWHGFAKQIFSMARRTGLIMKVDRLEAISTCEYPMAAKRPANSVLDNRKIERTFDIDIESWYAGLQTVVAHYRQSQGETSDD